MAQTDRQKIQVKLERLREAIRHHDHLYYVVNRPEVSDSEYDRLFRELQSLEAEHSDLIIPSSPTQRVGAPPLDQFQKVPHEYQMLSLDSHLDIEDVLAFDPTGPSRIGCGCRGLCRRTEIRRPLRSSLFTRMGRLFADQQGEMG